MFRRIIICLAAVGVTLSAQAQLRLDTSDVYRVNYWISGGISALGVASNIIGLQRIQGKPSITPEELSRVSRDDVNRFDRWALDLDPEKRDAAEEISNIAMTAGSLAPLLLLLDGEIRRDFLDIGLMYFETQMIAANLYSWSPLGPTFNERFRPVVYYDDLPDDDRNFRGFRNSFYSGHVATMTTGAFFTAKVYTDYHPELGGKKWLFYGMAALPSVGMAYLRVKALKHFPSDSLVGLGVGALMGIAVPEIHRLFQQRMMVGVTYGEEFKGVAMRVRF